MTSPRVLLAGLIATSLPAIAAAAYVNFEVSHVHPIALTPSGNRLLVVNTPDARLEVFTVGSGGALTHEASIPVGLEPVSVAARTDAEAWVANHLSDTISIVDLDLQTAARSLEVGDEPADVAFAGGRAFVAVSQEDAVKAYDLANLDLPPAVIPLFGNDARALAVSPDGTRVYAVVLHSGNQTTVVNANVVWDNNAGLDANRLNALGIPDMACDGAPPAYPPLPPGVVRNPALLDPPSGVPEVGLIVRWNESAGEWQDETGADWSHCLPFRLPDHDLFVIDVATRTVVDRVAHLGTTLFDVSVNPANGKIYVPHQEARNFVRFEHPLGVQGHVVDNRMAIVEPPGNGVKILDLNTHIDRASDPAANLAEREASISQPGMMAWKADGSEAFLTAIGSRKLFRVDGACGDGSCAFGPSRSAPDAVEVGEGPTGVAFHEGVGRAYVLLRFSNSVAVVDATALTKIDEIALHDASPAVVRDGRHFLYDGIDSSGHGDNACSSCHVSGDFDLLAWDLGDPTGSLAPYSTPNDNVRFITLGGVPCNPALPFCASHAGFDPQKGPMTTQTLRAMLEPLHWRGDRATMNDFNPAFVGLLGKAPVGQVNGKPAGQTPADMETFRQFALGIRFPPNPYRLVDDTLPAGDQRFGDSPFAGDPQTGETLFFTANTDGGGPCVACHTLPHGAAGGVLGGVTPAEPTSMSAAALFNGTLDGSRHSDLKVPHMRNMYEKFGPLFGDRTDPPDRKSGFGYIHDGSIGDLHVFLSAAVFNLSAANQAKQVRDLAAFSLAFPTGTRPAVGRQVTVAPGAPPAVEAGEPPEALLATLISLGALNDPGRHCELTATALDAGRMRAWRLLDKAGGGSWGTDLAGEPPVTTGRLRESADGPITFLCATIGSGVRLGGDRDEDAVLDGDDCNPADAEAWSPAAQVAGLVVSAGSPALAWTDQSPVTGPGVRYDVAAGSVLDLRVLGLAPATACLIGDLADAFADDPGLAPAVGDGRYYLVRARNSCASPGFGPGRESLAALACP
jgi:DNA-binding beta-propeller fold protein YncE